MTTVISPCQSCVWYATARKCLAFDNVPDDIWFAENDHREPYPGDNGIQYEPIDEEPDNGINNDNGNG